MAQHSETQPSIGKGVWRVVFVIAIIVLVASLIGLGAMAFSYLQGQMKYDEVAKTSGFDADDIESAELAEVTVDWDALLAANPETVAWLYVPHTNINYPIVQHSDNDYYLTHDFDEDAGWLANYGAVFMDYRNKADWSDQMYFIYGHHMNDGSMFTDLAGMTEQARFDECRTLYLLTPKGNFKLNSFAMQHIEADEEVVQQNFPKAEDMVAYVQSAIDRSTADPGDIPKAADIDKVFALATCDNLTTDGRYILYAYVEETTAKGLTGDLGLSESEGQTTGFANDLQVEEKAPESDGQSEDEASDSDEQWEDEEG